MAEWVQNKITLSADYISTVADYMQAEVNEDIEQVDELKYETLRSYTDKAKAENLPGKDSRRGVALLTPGTRDKGVHRVVDRMKKMPQHPSNQRNEEVELDEARGRPAGAATLAKRAAAAKPRDDDDDGDHYDADSGVEADQHIHVQLKKAVDSTMKPYEVSFKNGKKHAVSSHVAKNLLDATERLKPEHRKNVHDEIHKSYDNLLAVHKMIVGK
jgi:hypothetical protein